MGSYREQSNEYKAKRAGIVDAKVVAPKGRKKKVDKPWMVFISYGLEPISIWKTWRKEFQHENDARAFMRKHNDTRWKQAWLEHNGKKVD